MVCLSCRFSFFLQKISLTAVLQHVKRFCKDWHIPGCPKSEALPVVWGNRGIKPFISGEQGNKSLKLKGTKAIFGNREHIENQDFDFVEQGKMPIFSGYTACTSILYHILEVPSHKQHQPNSPHPAPNPPPPAPPPPPPTPSHPEGYKK